MGENRPRQTEKLDEQCMYPSRKCFHLRATKKSGKLHKLCEDHRQQANRNQKRLQQRRKMQQFQELQEYVMQTFAQAPPPPDNSSHHHERGAYSPYAYSGGYDSFGFDFPASGSGNCNNYYDPFMGYYQENREDLDADPANPGSLSPLRGDEDESVRRLSQEDLDFLLELLDDP